jgi:glycosyltransferase involved in cell wall biosynthesis
MKLSIIGKTKNSWLNEIIKNFPINVHKRTIILIGPFFQILLTPLMRIFLYKVIWIADNPKYNILLKFFSLFAEKIIIPNQSIEANYLRLGIPNQKLQLIYPICSFSEERIKRQDSLVLSCDGSLSIENGTGTLLRGFSMAQEILGNLKLIIGGNIIEKTRIEWLINEINIKNSVQLAPSNNHLWSEQSHIYVWMDNSEQPTPISLIQAVCFGKAIIASDKLSNHEFIEQNKNGILIKSSNAEMFSQAIINLARKPEWITELGENNLDFGKHKFSAEIFRQKITTTFEL